MEMACRPSGEEGEETVRLIQQNGGGIVVVKTDMVQAVEVEALITKAVASNGRLGWAHNNAGIEGRAATAQAGVDRPRRR